MAIYKKILAVVDLTEDSDLVVERAKALASDDGTAVILLHVVEYVPLEPMGETVLPTVQIEGELVERAKEKLKTLAVNTGLAKSSQRVEIGGIKTEIPRIAQLVGADLIVVGSRERHGLAVLVNFIEDAVLHAAPCDVLAVRLH
jgi:universal stress protein A